MKLQYAAYIYVYCACRSVTASNYFAVVNGNISDAALLTNVTNIGALPSCAKRCEGPECVSFVYNSDTTVCSTFSTGLSISSEPLNTRDKYFQKEIEAVNCAPINVYGKWAKCNVFNSKRWTIVQRRYDGTNTFDKTWNEYKEGFGDLDGEYWIGNEALHRLTHETTQIAMFVIEDWDGVEKYAQYDNFRVSSETDKYRLTATGYSGTAGDCMSYHHGQQFSTKDNDNDALVGRSCSKPPDGTGFWHRSCFKCNINGPYGIAMTLAWESFSGNGPMRKSRMMLRRFP